MRSLRHFRDKIEKGRLFHILNLLESSISSREGWSVKRKLDHGNRREKARFLRRWEIFSRSRTSASVGRRIKLLR